MEIIKAQRQIEPDCGLLKTEKKENYRGVVWIEKIIWYISKITEVYFPKYINLFLFLIHEAFTGTEDKTTILLLDLMIG